VSVDVDVRGRARSHSIPLGRARLDASVPDLVRAALAGAARLSRAVLRLTARYDVVAEREDRRDELDDARSVGDRERDSPRRGLERVEA